MKTKQMKKVLFFYGLLSTFLWPQMTSASDENHESHAHETQSHESHTDHESHAHNSIDSVKSEQGHDQHELELKQEQHTNHAIDDQHNDHEDQIGHEKHIDHSDQGEHSDHDSQDEHEGHEGGEEHADRSEISEEMAKKIGISTQIASSGVINQTEVLYGTIAVDPSRVTHIKARFPGLITKVNVKVGDYVRKGQVLAEVEANQSLKRYKIRSPFSATVVTRHANSGELSEQKTLFTLANYEQMLAEFKVFPNQMGSVKKGQWISISSGTTIARGRIDYLLDSQDQQPYKIARVILDNELGGWASGLWLTGKVSVSEKLVPLLVDNRAIQSFENSMVVFVKEGEAYEAHPLQLGIQDDVSTEVLSGLEEGSHYVVENSYLIKADLEKSSAAHEH